MIIFAFLLVAALFHKLELCHAVLFDFFVGHFESLEQFCFGHLVHLAFDHHDVVVGRAYHEFDVGFFNLGESGIDHPLSVDTGYSYFRDRSVERYVGTCQRGRSRYTGKSIGGVLFRCRIQGYVYECLSVVVIRKERTQHTVYEA